MYRTSSLPASNPLHAFLRFFFWHFYHGFAWTYDFVAAFVSIGRWNDWIQCAIPFVRGRRVLEIGCGPGHLQVYLREQTAATVVGLDESSQMARLARSRLHEAAYSDIALARGLGQRLPFRDGSFDTVVATFPAEYIFEEPAVKEVRRVLAEEGRLVVVPAAWMIGRKALDRAAAWLFRVTDQAPRLPAEIFGDRLRSQFENAGFDAQVRTVEVRSSVVLVVVADRRNGGPNERLDQEVARAG